MRSTFALLLVLTVAVIAAGSHFGDALANQGPDGEKADATGNPMLKMVSITVSSSGSIKRLRTMPIDIIRIRPVAGRRSQKSSLSDRFVVEAVVPTHLLPKLKAMGFDVSEIVPKRK